MDKQLSVHQGKSSSKQAKSKKKPVKVVYISNPMKVKTSASDFRALVQELTGQDSDIADAASRYSSENDRVDEGLRTVPNNEGMMMEIRNDTNFNEDGAIQEETSRVDPYVEAIRSLDSTFEHFEPFDRAFSPYMQDNFNGFTPSGLLYDVPRTIEKP
ncbi:hypothetical protein AQUCO_00400796v1 [Aquilegia coerulea]|uniref:VQ domain-containing protein n=1 Tax=Aquilegia coerulea TaxID=218851 RepID=A0A2G5EWK0_AQUCA|nr:hypothetical protein AQUCO_00400796v1 [Aquilegia coerulea]